MSSPRSSPSSGSSANKESVTNVGGMNFKSSVSVDDGRQSSSATDNNSSAVDLLPKQRHPFVSEASLKELIHQVKAMLQSGRSTVEPRKEEEKPRKEEEKPKPRIYPREYLLW